MISIADERDAIQKKTFTKWVNKHLRKVITNQSLLVLCLSLFAYKVAIDFKLSPPSPLIVVDPLESNVKMFLQTFLRVEFLCVFFSLSLLWEKCEQKSFDRWGTSNFVQFREMFQLPFIRIHVTFSSSPTHFVQLSLCPSVSFCLETKSERSSCFVSKRKKKTRIGNFHSFSCISEKRIMWIAWGCVILEGVNCWKGLSSILHDVLCVWHECFFVSSVDLHANWAHRRKNLRWHHMNSIQIGRSSFYFLKEQKTLNDVFFWGGVHPSSRWPCKDETTVCVIGNKIVHPNRWCSTTTKSFSLCVSVSVCLVDVFPETDKSRVRKEEF